MGHPPLLINEWYWRNEQGVKEGYQEVVHPSVASTMLLEGTAVEA